MIYRKWELKDIGEVVELEKKCFPDPWNADMVLSSFNQPRFIGFVAEENGKVTAYLGATAILSDSDVLLVAVDENFRKKGVATALFKLLFAAEADAAANAALSVCTFFQFMRKKLCNMTQITPQSVAVVYFT